ncbi:twin-arginine translocase TatA/TatE family subunit [Legionella jordanis]|uniref:TatB protein (Twin arginine translocation) n=1 Tax=Legionella jordanis TaxID=456 RepID=A0A0W0VCK4_9GAMM|nr:twin-arginine translocase TatA/TatE family subunit [Legionella jordanis]KTD17834.1 TatB protein (twin arginine translocation) [Legionella jordanis]RMX02465.1 preprotein translocase subunit TatB [Legionella jordanis]RMX21692.1 preprotein translocase subunit TatB [Legionella jordanis]VEH11229.1 sec-independent protein translocase protein TatB [Legionella jordanis]HAT8713803.1 preprotein translocase subunit TatB [Legionella jordanis]
MSSAELLIIILVAIIVFGPNKLPMLAEHLGKLYKQFLHLKEQAMAFWQARWNEQQLRENLKKAEQADACYQQPNSRKLESSSELQADCQEDKEPERRDAN